MENLDRSFNSALDAVLDAGRTRNELGARKNSLLQKLVNIGYENQFSPEDRIKARRNIKEVITDHLGQGKSESTDL